MRFHVAVVPILAIHAADDLYRALAAEKGQIPVHRGQRQVGNPGLELAVYPFGGGVARGGAQTLQDRVPLGAVPCGAFHVGSPFA